MWVAVVEVELAGVGNTAKLEVEVGDVEDDERGGGVADLEHAGEDEADSAVSVGKDVSAEEAEWDRPD